MWCVVPEMKITERIFTVAGARFSADGEASDELIYVVAGLV